jgi:hypothetical protein
MDVYQPSGYGKKRRRRRRSISGGGGVSSSLMTNSKTNATSIDYSAPLSQHWSTYADEIILDNAGNEEEEEEEKEEVKGHPGLITLPLKENNVHKEDIEETVQKYLSMKSSSKSPGLNKKPEQKNNGSTENFGDNIGFSVIMPSGKIDLICYDPPHLNL